MFTGIVDSLGTLRSITLKEGGARVVLDFPSHWEAAALGESIAVNGCCLTVSEITEDTVAFDLLAETLALTNLGALTAGSRVNLERALRVGDRLGGHFVLGHIDCQGEITTLEEIGNDVRLDVRFPEEFADLVAYKGSVAIDGISLTTAEVNGNTLTCWITPHTRSVTNLAFNRTGWRPNLEFDVLARYVLGARKAN
jgi:riboflavin synthase